MLLSLVLCASAVHTQGDRRLPTPSPIIPTCDPPLDITYPRPKVPAVKNTRPALQKAGFPSKLTSKILALLPLANLLTVTAVNRMLEDKDMATYVHWHQERGLYGLLIPDIDAFVEHALPKHFAGVKKWGSFQKQLNNYGFEKQDRASTIDFSTLELTSFLNPTLPSHRAFYTHWNNKFCQGHPELLPEVIRRPDRAVKTSSRQDAVQNQPATTSDVCSVGPQPSSQLELQARIIRLENDLNDIKNEYRRMINENNQLKHENNQLKTEVLGLQRRLSVSEGRLDQLETNVQDVMRERAARPVGGGLLNSVGDRGLGVEVFNDNFRPNEAGNNSGILDGSALKPQTGVYNFGNSHVPSLRPGTTISDDTINPTMLGQPFHRQSSGFDPTANPGISLSYPGEHSTPVGSLPQTFLIQDASQNGSAAMHAVDASSSHLPTSFTSANARPSFAHNAPTVTVTSQSSIRFQASGAPGVLGRRGPLGAIFRVPPWPPPNGPERYL
ncbi:hypothetical protein FRC00_003798 [Tulasnella sp. 408]|nr:hypothetical protein FRC00_003798 [Tulasnella sp. 408]